MAAVLLVLRPAAFIIQHLVMNQAIAANVSNRIRWQNHWHVVRQSWAFFQNDFAGRIATRVMQTGPGDPRESGRAAHRRLVHPGLRHVVADPARRGRSLAGAARSLHLVRRLYGDAALLRAAHARHARR